MSVKLERVRHPLACFTGEINVDGQKTAQAEIKLALILSSIDGLSESNARESH